MMCISQELVRHSFGGLHLGLISFYNLSLLDEEGTMKVRIHMEGFL